MELLSLLDAFVVAEDANRGILGLPLHRYQTRFDEDAPERTGDPQGRNPFHFRRGIPVGTPENLSILLREQAWPIMIGLICLGLVYVLLKLSAGRRLHRLAEQRKDVTENTFASHLERYGFDPLITRSTFRYLQEVQQIQFPVLPGDKLDEDLGLDSEDVDQTVRELSAALHREYTPGLRFAPIVTVEDLVRLIQASPRLSRRRERVAA